MKNRKKVITIVISVAAVLILAGITAIAAGLGSSSDPLVTLSYINSTVKPDIEKYADNKVADLNDKLTAAFDEKLDEFSDDLDMKLDDAMGAGEGEVFVEVALSKGEIVALNIGAELMLREGSAEANGALTDVTSGTSTDGDLAINHMYVAARNGEITATSDRTKLLIKGDYTIQ